MNGMTKKVLGSATRTAIAGLTLLGAGVVGCTDGTTTATVAYAYDNPYVYSTYYPVATAYSGYYWADSWNYYAFYYVGAAPTGVVRESAISSLGIGGARGVGDRKS